MWKFCLCFAARPIVGQFHHLHELCCFQHAFLVFLDLFTSDVTSDSVESSREQSEVGGVEGLVSFEAWTGGENHTEREGPTGRRRRREERNEVEQLTGPAVRGLPDGCALVFFSGPLSVGKAKLLI